jgi:hypothetical protein
MAGVIQRTQPYRLAKVGYSRSYPIEGNDSTFHGKRAGVKGYLWIPANTYVVIYVSEYLDGSRLSMKVEKYDWQDKMTDSFGVVMDRDEFLKMIETK